MSAGVLPSFLQRQLVDDAVVAYVAWREESATVWAAYGRWSSAAAEEAIRAHAAYNAALDREEIAAHVYARLVERVSELLETGV
jgi:hypothetical protein